VLNTLAAETFCANPDYTFKSAVSWLLSIFENLLKTLLHCIVPFRINPLSPAASPRCEGLGGLFRAQFAISVVVWDFVFLLYYSTLILNNARLVRDSLATCDVPLN